MCHHVLGTPHFLIPSTGDDPTLIPFDGFFRFAGIAITLRQIVHVALILGFFLQALFEQRNVPLEFVWAVRSVGMIVKECLVRRDRAAGCQIQILVRHAAVAIRFPALGEAAVRVVQHTGDLNHVIGRRALQKVKPHGVDNLKFHVSVEEQDVVELILGLLCSKQSNIARLREVFKFTVDNLPWNSLSLKEIFDQIRSAIGAASIGDHVAGNVGGSGFEGANDAISFVPHDHIQTEAHLGNAPWGMVPMEYR